MSSSTATQQNTLLKGGEWLIKESAPSETFIRKNFNEEQQILKDMCISFLDAEVIPVL